MASLTSSLSTRNWSYNVFASFHGPDVRKTLLSHMREQFNVSGITMYNDQKMVRSEEIAPSLTNGIRESRIAIVILSKKYASSSWCLDELVEILECKKTMGQKVMTIFYGVEPSDVRKQTGEFGIAFEDTCEHKTKEAKQKWIKALTDVSNIAGEDFLRWENNHSGFDEHGWKLRLQEQFLSNLLNLGRIRIGHSGVIEERLSKHRVLIILDDVYHIKQLEALANKTTWFGSGSRIIITTENKEILQQHGIKNMYRVGLPSDEQALKILCRYAFGNNSHNQGFEKLVPRVTKLCDKLPLGLSVVGSSLRGKEADEWEEVLSRLETNLDRDSGTILDRDIDDVLRVGYESLDENEQTLFLHIAVFFNYKSWNLVNTMFDDSDLDVKHGLKILVNRSLIKETIGYEHRIVMHRLLEQMGKRAIQKQDPWKRRILTNAREICDVLQHAKELEIIACGVQIMTEENKRRRMIEFDETSKASQDSRDSELMRDRLICDSKENGKAETHTGCWSWILLSLDLSHPMRSIASLFWGRRP
ncbi:unnamed protein product [Brassica rapa]|uniref:TIR domain-containing protein n=1 Tax=Brassica campestris TaxID=3711 RepID=A0A8D9FYA3_BRACM|nr:unnamed protein product [Brassica rapa]